MNYKQHKSCAKHRRLLHELTEAEFAKLQAGDCVYCLGPGGGIDRTDPKLGYTLDNCVSSCHRCNARKQVYEPLGVDVSIAKARELAHRNQLPPPSAREWKHWGCYKAIKPPV
jgi:hypothetical protein